MPPWDHPVDGLALLDDVAETVRRFVALRESEASAVALWVVFSHVHDEFRTSPILAVVSPEKRCGKSTLLSVLSQLVPRPLPTSNVTPAVVFRAINANHPTLLLDEMDTYLEGRGELVGILNSGHTRELATVSRSRADSFEPEHFSTWSPKILAKIGALPPTIEDRSIVISLRRKLPTESTAKLTSVAVSELRILHRKLARWADDNRSRLSEVESIIPSAVTDRAADNWWPLLAVAQLAGPRWATEARRCAVVMTEVVDDAADSSLRLLSDIREVFESDEAVQMNSVDLFNRLSGIVDSPWSDLRKSMKFSANVLARRLKPFGVRPKTLWAGGTSGKSSKGYRLEELQDAFLRYLPARNGETGEVPEVADLTDLTDADGGHA